MLLGMARCAALGAVTGYLLCRARSEVTGADVFAHYCGAPPETQWVEVPGPLQREAHDLELVGLQVIFRHGVRDTTGDLTCVRRAKHQINFSCNMNALAGLDLEGSGASPLSLPKQYHDAYPSVDGHGAGCGRGELLREAVPQFQALAEALQERYLSMLPQRQSLDNTRLFAVDADRIMGSMVLLHYFLFRDSHEEHASSRTFIKTRPIDSDPWHMSPRCPKALKAKARQGRIKQSVVDNMTSFGERWQNLSGADFTAKTWDCLTVAQCTHQSFLDLPEKIQPQSQNFLDALAASAQVATAPYVLERDAYKLLSAPALHEVLDFARGQASGRVAQLALRATSDTMIIPLLIGLDAWDGSWPHFAETLLLEVYVSQANQSKTFVRFLRRGRVVELPHCREHHGILGLCDIDTFLPEAMRMMGDPAVYEKLCHVSESEQVDVIEERRAVEDNSRLIFGTWELGIFALVTLMLGFTLGRLTGPRRQSDLPLLARDSYEG